MNYHKIVTAKAPVNIAVIKYWGKSVETLKIPLNDSISGTLSTNELSATTSAAISNKFDTDKLWLNGEEQILDEKSQAKRLIEDIRHIALNELGSDDANLKVRIVSINNFPTAAGLASSAAGYACLAFVLGHLYGLTDLTRLSMLARKGSGSACRSLFGGFVQWFKGTNSQDSIAKQIVNSQHWPQMRVVLCVANDHKKDVSSSVGMARSVATSSLLYHRVQTIVPDRVNRMRNAILKRNFDEFAELTMLESNQFHAICLDTWPPLFYLNDSSKAIIDFCSRINSKFGETKVAYTFDAGPNACIYVLDNFVNILLALIEKFFPQTNNLTSQKREETIKICGIAPSRHVNVDELVNELESMGQTCCPNAIKYIINTSIGDGPVLLDSHIESENFIA